MMPSMNRIVLWLGIAAAAAAITACNGNGTPSTPASCGSPPGVSQTVLVYPAPNSTAVPDAVGSIVVGSTASIPSSWNIVVTTALTPQGAGGGAFRGAAPPFPTPNATPSFANPVYQSSSFAGATFPGEVVTAFLNNLNSNCNPNIQIGSFTTQ